MKKIQITEALRLKKEIANYYNGMIYKLNHNLYLGKTYIDDVEQTNLIVNKTPFLDGINHLIQISLFSEEINSKLAEFNVKSGISDLVRCRENVKLSIDVINKYIEKSKPVVNENITITSSGEKIKTVTKYVPSITEDVLKEQQLSYNKLIREYQNKIDKLNQKTITLSFDFDDFEKSKLF